MDYRFLMSSNYVRNCVKDNNGALWIRKRRQKTSVMCNVPLLTLSQEILNEYKGHQRVEMSSAVPSNQPSMDI